MTSLFATVTTRALANDVFGVIGQWKRVDLQDLQRETGLDRFTLRQRLDRLLAEDLVAEVPAPIEDFTMFFLTPKGVHVFEDFDVNTGSNSAAEDC